MIEGVNLMTTVYYFERAESWWTYYARQYKIAPERSSRLMMGRSRNMLVSANLNPSMDLMI